MSNRAQMLRNLYIRGRINKVGLRKAVVDAVLTKDEYYIITGEVYE